MKRFITEYTKDDGKHYGGTVDACDFFHAQMLCDQRGLGETVTGTLHAVIQANPSFGNTQADAMAKAFAEAGDDEAPDADVFDQHKRR